MTTDLAAWRGEFPIVETTNYLISNSLGAMPRGTKESLARYADTWTTRGVRAWEEGWWELPVTVGDMVAPIIGAPPGSVTMHQNVTLAEAIVLSCFTPLGRRNKIVFEDENFSSVQYFFSRQPGWRVEAVPKERLLDAIDADTVLVPVSHVLFKSAYVQDASAIVERAHRVGAHVVLDVYQSAGVLPLDVAALGVDFAVGGCLKWLCGGPGNGYLYVRPDLRGRLQPTLTGWMAHPEPFAFAPLPMRYADTPFRFLNGTPPIPSLHAALEGLRIVREVGVERIRAHSLRLTDRLLQHADEAGLPSLTPREHARRGGTVAVNPPTAEAISRELLQTDILIDYRPGAGIRIAPHFYNTEDECDEVIGEIAALAAGRPRLRRTQSR
jgi:kynureninase